MLRREAGETPCACLRPGVSLVHVEREGNDTMHHYTVDDDDAHLY
jgi:hypothetical protein